MSRAEKFISDCTRNCSNGILEREYDEIGCRVIKEYNSWLTPDQARRAVEIAREEVIEQTVEWLTKHAIKYYINSKGFLGTDELVEDFKLAMDFFLGKETIDNIDVRYHASCGQQKRTKSDVENLLSVADMLHPMPCPTFDIEEYYKGGISHVEFGELKVPLPIPDKGMKWAVEWRELLNAEIVPELKQVPVNDKDIKV